jgi:DNA-binding transcriptional LysR family regulator
MFDDIIIFVKLAEMGSFSKLSKILNLAQSTISHRIKGLEYALGQKLLIRNSNGIALTESGQMLFEKFQHHNTYLKKTLEEFSNTDISQKSTLRVVLPTVISKSIITPYLCDFLEDYPNINLNISFTSGFVDVIREGFDVAVTVVTPKSNNSISKLLYNFEVKLYASPNFFLTHPPINTLEDALQQPIAGFVTVDGVAVNNFIAKNLITGETVAIGDREHQLYINNVLHVQQIAHSGKILVPGWDFFTEDSLKSNVLVRVLPEYSFGEVSCYLVVPSIESTIAQRLFAEFIEQCFDKFRQDEIKKLNAIITQ